MTSHSASEQNDFAATLRADYEQTNQQIRMLADIRFKLLALVPTLTAAAALLTSATMAPGTVLAVGLLGFFAVFAIAMYDLRNSQIYDAAISRAKQLEKQLRMPSFAGNRSGGVYSDRPGHDVRLFRIQVWHDRALAFIYGTALGGWFWIITYSLLSIVSLVFQWPSSPLFKQYINAAYVASILIAAPVAYAFIWQFHQIEATRQGARQLSHIRVVMPYTIENQQPKPGKKYVFVELFLKNGGERRFKYNVSKLKLQDNDGYKHNTTTDLEQYLTKGTLAPGELTWSGVVYEIPEKNTPAKLIYTPRPSFLNVQQIIDLTKYFTRDIVLIRHGDKDSSYPLDKDHKDRYWPLSQEGMDKINRLKDRLAHLNLNPEIYLTSTHEHAKHTAELLSDGRPIVYLDTLTPDSSEDSLESIINEAKKNRIELSQQTAIVIVGHEPQLDEILARLTSMPVPLPYLINRAEAVWVRADSFFDLLHGKGVVHDWKSGDEGPAGSIGGGGSAGGE